MHKQYSPLLSISPINILISNTTKYTQCFWILVLLRRSFVMEVSNITSFSSQMVDCKYATESLFCLSFSTQVRMMTVLIFKEIWRIWCDVHPKTCAGSQGIYTILFTQSGLGPCIVWCRWSHSSPPILTVGIHWAFKMNPPHGKKNPRGPQKSKGHRCCSEWYVPQQRAWHFL